MRDTPDTVTAAEREIYRDYDRQRRLRLVRAIAPLFFGLAAFLWPALTIFVLFVLPQNQRSVSIIVADAIVGLCTALFAVGYLAARRQRVNLAAGLVTAATGLAIVTLGGAWATVRGIDPFLLVDFMSFAVAIVLAGVLGERWMVIVTTLITNALSVWVSLAAPRIFISAALIDGQVLLFIPLAIVEEWALAVLLLSVQGAYQRTLRELGDVRVAMERARKLDELKDQFISSVNHELRNPVMAMLGYIELLQDSAASASTSTSVPSDRMTRYIQRASKAGQALRTLLASILETRRLDQGATDFTPEAVDILTELEAAIEFVDPSEGNLVERELRVSIPSGLAIWGERVRLQQIFTNLLSNAIKYSAPGTPIEVRAWVEQDAARVQRRWRTRDTPTTVPQVARLSVRDYGLGIPPDQIPLLFQRFVRLPRDLASSVVGNGLGLHLCRVLAEAMGGHIWVESTGIAGEGSTFQMRLPLPPRDRVGPFTPNQEGHPTPGPSVDPVSRS
jgi:signal transduction histidine kinase